MHASWGAYEANLWAAVCSLVFALIWLYSWWRARAAYLLLLCVGWLGLCLYFSLLAISAGTAPVIRRDEITTALRMILAASFAWLAAGKVALVWLGFRAGRCARGTI